MGAPFAILRHSDSAPKLTTLHVRKPMIARQIDLVMPAGHTVTVHAYGSGRPMILLHGFPLDAEIWRPCCERLTTAGYEVLAPDLRGFGSSSALDINTSLSIADLADDIEEVRRVLIGTEKIVLGGLSLGGYVALEFWKRHGEQLRALILSNTKPQADSEEARQGRLAMADKALKETSWDAVAPMLNKLLSEQTRQQAPATTQAIQTMMSSVPATTIAAIQKAMAQRHDFTEELGLIRVPTLVITGEHDPISPPNDNRQWASRIAHHRLEILPGAAHLPQIETPDAICATIIDFCASELP